MKLFDTHSHYNDEQFDEDREEIIKLIYEAGIENIVVVRRQYREFKKSYRFS